MTTEKRPKRTPHGSLGPISRVPLLIIRTIRQQTVGTEKTRSLRSRKYSSDGVCWFASSPVCGRSVLAGCLRVRWRND
jgi:hypothetical protein